MAARCGVLGCAVGTLVLVFVGRGGAATARAGGTTVGTGVWPARHPPEVAGLPLPGSDSGADQGARNPVQPHAHARTRGHEQAEAEANDERDYQELAHGKLLSCVCGTPRLPAIGVGRLLEQIAHDTADAWNCAEVHLMMNTADAVSGPPRVGSPRRLGTHSAGVENWDPTEATAIKRLEPPRE